MLESKREAEKALVNGCVDSGGCYCHASNRVK